ncbi:hypothetical protein PENSPDRAFT_754292 [Peniophora sp. CONT]|nr:hypothetical protein PENSPDRAFT_754292 [Peniophora sp. CONT]
MSRPRPGVDSSGLDLEQTSTPRSKRQRVEVALDPRNRQTSSTGTRLQSSQARGTSSVVRGPVQPRAASSSTMARTPTSMPPTPSRTRKRKASVLDDEEDTSFTDQHRDVSVPDREPFNMSRWKDGLRRLYSTNATSSADDVTASLEALFSELPDDQETRKTASDYVASLVVVVQGSVRIEHERTRVRRDGLFDELVDAQGRVDDAQAQLAQAQDRADEAQLKLYEAERECDEKEETVEKTKDVTEIIEELAAASIAHNSDGAAGSEESDTERESSLEATDEVIPSTLSGEDVIIVHGTLDDIVRKYNARYLPYSSRSKQSKPTKDLDWKIWFLRVNGESESDEGDEPDGAVRFAFCTKTDAVEIPPLLKCQNCRASRELRGFPEPDPTVSQPVKHRCLMKFDARGKQLMCMCCRAVRNGTACGIDEVAVRKYLLELQLERIKA